MKQSKTSLICLCMLFVQVSLSPFITCNKTIVKVSVFLCNMDFVKVEHGSVMKTFTKEGNGCVVICEQLLAVCVVMLHLVNT